MAYGKGKNSWEVLRVLGLHQMKHHAEDVPGSRWDAIAPAKITLNLITQTRR